MFYVSVHGHKVFPGASSACRIVFKNLTGANLLNRYGEVKGAEGEALARAHYLGFMTEQLGVHMTSGTPVALVSESGEVIESGSVPKTPPPTFETESATNIATQSQEARQRGEQRSSNVALNSREVFAETYGWLAGASNPADDAKLAEEKLMAELGR